MIIEEPYLVFTMARSKSSWVTQTVIEATGAWVGTSSRPVRGYPKGQLENRRIFDLQRQWFGRGWLKADAGEEIRPKPGFRAAVHDTIRADGYPGGPWVYKVSAVYWRAFTAAFPGAVLITVRRDIDEIKASAARHNGNHASDKVIHAHFDAMDRLRDECGAYEVWPSAHPEHIDELREWLTMQRQNRA